MVGQPRGLWFRFSIGQKDIEKYLSVVSPTNSALKMSMS